MTSSFVWKCVFDILISGSEFHLFDLLERIPKRDWFCWELLNLWAESKGSIYPINFVFVQRQLHIEVVFWYSRGSNYTLWIHGCLYHWCRYSSPNDHQQAIFCHFVHSSIRFNGCPYVFTSIVRIKDFYSHATRLYTPLCLSVCR